MKTQAKPNKINIAVFIALLLLCLAGLSTAMSFSETTAYADSTIVVSIAPKDFTTSYDQGTDSYIITGFNTSSEEWAKMSVEDKANISIVIPAEYVGKNGLRPVSAIGDSAFSCDEIKYDGYTFTSLNLMGATNLTTIGMSAFNKCESLDGELTIPKSVETISSGAFNDCKSLDALTFETGSNLEEIGRYAFGNCESLVGELTIPKSVKKIWDYAFHRCSSFDKLTFDSDTALTIIDASTFYGCSSLGGDLTIPKSITTIGPSAFDSCKSLTALKFEEGSALATINSNAFKNCENLSGDLTIPKSMTKIGSYAFDGCKSLTALKFEDGSALTTIETNAFKNCTSLNGGLTIPKSVTKIEEYAFNGCSSLQTVYLPSREITYEENVFYGVLETCPIIAASVEDYAVFTSLEHTLSVYKNLTYETQVTFDGKGGAVVGTSTQTKLYNLSIKYEKDSAKNIWAINEGYKLPTATKENCRFEQWNDANNVKLDINSTVGDSKTYTAQYDPLEFIVDYDSGNRTYIITGFNPEFLERLTQKNNIAIVIPAEYVGGYGLRPVSAIGENAFSCDGNKHDGFTFTSLDLMKATNLTTINYGSFNGCSSLGGDLTIPNTVTKIDEHAFEGCNSLTALKFEDGSALATIGNYAFNGCSGISGVITIPNTVITIGISAFNGCSSLQTVYLPSVNVTYNENVFNGVLETCPIIAASVEDYTVFTSLEHTLSAYKNLTYETEVNFDGNGGTVVGTSTQTKLYNLSIKYEKDSAKNIWAINEDYKLPTATKDNCRFEQWNDANNAKLDINSTVGDSKTYTVQYEVLTLAGIKAEFNQGNNIIYTSKPLDALREWLTVTGINNDGLPRVETIEYKLSGMLTEGVCTITVTGKGTEFTDTFNVIVTAVKLLSITVTTLPTKTVYSVAENFDCSGMVVMAMFSDGTRVITDYSIEGGMNLAEGTTAVTVSYMFDGVTVTASVPITLITPNNNTTITIVISVSVFLLLLLLLLLLRSKILPRRKVKKIKAK